jgi:teichoic acid transport system ATP-binding protein
MDASDVSVEVRDLHVRYTVYEERPLAARELLRRGFRPRRAIEIHALKGVDLTVHRGEAVGIIGSNGSGKSTLLRAIAGLQPKSSGEVLVAGQANLLSVNAALKPQLTGYRNVMLGGLAMGLSREEIEAEMDAVIEFSGIGDAINRPMQTFSSGMMARLAFSIATLRVPDVLLIDEALAVGDNVFRERSLDRINEIRSQANSVLMVTHNFPEVRKTCDRVVWIDHGEIVGSGPVDEMLGRYEAHSAAITKADSLQRHD